MTTFLRLLSEKNKPLALLQAVQGGDPRAFDLDPTLFRKIPGAPFAYWVNESVRDIFEQLPSFGEDDRSIRVGLQTGDDFRFVRTWWETSGSGERWPGFAKGGAYSPFYADIHLVVNWMHDGVEIRNFFDRKSGKLYSRPQNTEFFRRPGLTWSDRTTRRLSPRPMPANVVFSVKGSAGFFPGSELSALGLMNSDAFDLLISLMVGAGDAAAKSYQVGTIAQVPYPGCHESIGDLARRAWKIKRTLDTVEETSHAFLLPAVLRSRLGAFSPEEFLSELVKIQTEIDTLAFEAYGISNTDQFASTTSLQTDPIDTFDEDNEEEEGFEIEERSTDALLSWAVGVAMGRFDWRLATGEREAPPEPEPFDPLPAKSPGMLPDGDAPFHEHRGILLDAPGHPDDLARLVEEVLTRVEVPVPGDVRRWLQRDFFPFHLQRYSKSRRKAPIYWPLTTTSGSYTLWVYYPSLTSQTLYTAINDYVEPRLKQVGADVTALRNKGVARTREDEKQFESLQALELELIELRDTLLKIAPTYHPNHDDGVQITAAPLWPLFRHKPWQKVLKDTWAKLEKGDYDWAHLALHYWPDRVREKCKTDKSLAIAHNLEDLYIEPAPKPGKAKAKKQKRGETG